MVDDSKNSRELFAVGRASQVFLFSPLCYIVQLETLVGRFCYLSPELGSAHCWDPHPILATSRASRKNPTLPQGHFLPVHTHPGTPSFMPRPKEHYPLTILSKLRLVILNTEVCGTDTQIFSLYVRR